MRQGGRSIVSKVLRASNMPRLPRDDIKIIVRSRDGLNIRSTCGVSLDKAIRNGAGLGDDEMITICPNPTQNILVISTPEEKTALKIVKIKVLTIDGKRYETNAYVSAPEQMVKGIIRNIPLKYTQDQLGHALDPILLYIRPLRGCRARRCNCGKQRHEPGGAGLPLPHVVNAPTILNRSRNANATHTEAGGPHGQSRPPQHL
ncbi:hypothetical protein MTO96_029476 [Rhipicephalus appendiculatus]